MIQSLKAAAECIDIDLTELQVFIAGAASLLEYAKRVCSPDAPDCVSISKLEEFCADYLDPSMH